MKTVVTGASGGIGGAVAREFLAKGHEVFGVDIRESGISDPRYRHFLVDLRKRDYPDLPDPEILIYAAGTQEEEEAFAVNLEGTVAFHEKYEACPSLRSVLFIASASARNGSEFPRYAASKAGVVGYMKNRALALAKRGITVNSLSPGGVITGSNRHILENADLYAAAKAETLLGKWAEPEEIAELAYFLTVRNRSITGEDILIDNGEILKSNFIW
ncbi:MAG: SDR family oxidoreductase [Clostridia bacterium]|nr:SDR family oxidoreductase [Clostridia bacterium]MBR5742602.1 SDR family oxidoreductase [Clostridia bacterium]